MTLGFLRLIQFTVSMYLSADLFGGKSRLEERRWNAWNMDDLVLLNIHVERIQS